MAIKGLVSLPVIGIIKRDYPDSEVFITATLKEVDELMAVAPEIVALDATARKRPGGVSLDMLIAQIRTRYPSLLLMADIATVQEAVTAQALGFDCVGTTLYGYTAETAGHSLPENDCAFLKEVLSAVTIPVIAEGNVDTPIARRCLALGRTRLSSAGRSPDHSKLRNGLWRQLARKAPMEHDHLTGICDTYRLSP